MIIIKLYNYIYAWFMKIFYKIIYGKKFKYGKRFVFRTGFTLMLDAKSMVDIGDDVFFNKGCTIDSTCKVTIGSGTIVGENVKIYDHNHRFHQFNQSIKSQGFKSEPISIGKHCWIGSGVIIVKGANIGDNCVIGAGCIINCPVTDGTIVYQDSSLLSFDKIKSY